MLVRRCVLVASISLPCCAAPEPAPQAMAKKTGETPAAAKPVSGADGGAVAPADGAVAPADGGAVAPADGGAVAPADGGGVAPAGKPDPSPKPRRPIARDTGPAMESPAGTGFWLAGYRRGDLHVYDLETELVVAGAGSFARALEDGTLERIEGTTAGLVDPGTMFLAGWSLQALGGRWPDPVWAFTQTEYQRGSSSPFMYYRKGDRWQRKATATGILDWYYQAFAPWQDGQVLALRLLRPRPEIGEGSEGPSPEEEKRIAAAEAKNPPRLDVLAAGAAPAPAPFRLAAKATPLGLGAARTGEVFVLLVFLERKVTEDDVVETRRYAVQRFKPGAAEGPVDALPQLAGRAWGVGQVIHVQGADEVRVFGHDAADAGLILRWDGRSWAQEAAPPGGTVQAVAVAGATLWAIAEPAGEPEGDEPIPALWKRAGGAWTKVALPQVREPGAEAGQWIRNDAEDEWLFDPPESAPDYRVVKPAELLVRGEDLWIAGPLAGLTSADGLWTGHAVLRSRPVVRALSFPSDANLRSEVVELSAKPPKWSDDARCGLVDPWVRLAASPKDAPPERAAQLVQEILAGLPAEQREAVVHVREVEVHGRRVLGAQVEMMDQAESRAFVEALKKVRPDEEHPVECRDPRPIRELYRKGSAGSAGPAASP